MFMLLTFCALNAEAQRSALKFDAEEWNFGPIREADGPVTHEFRFVNSGAGPVAIVGAAASCGCTVPRFSREPVMPGGTGTVGVTFDPANRTGAFRKSVTLYTSEARNSVSLYIEGTIEPRERSDEERYPIAAADGVRFDTNYHAFGYVRHGRTLQGAVSCINTSHAPVRLRVVPRTQSGFLTIDAPDRLAPREQAAVNFRYAIPAASGRYGALCDELLVEVNGKPAAVIVITGVAVDALPEPDNLTGRAELTENSVKFGTVNRRSGVVSRPVSILNRGEAPLTVRSVESGRFGCTLEVGRQVPVDGTVEFRVTLDPKRQDCGMLAEKLVIITDDPERPVRTLRATAVIVEAD